MQDEIPDPFWFSWWTKLGRYWFLAGLQILEVVLLKDPQKNSSLTSVLGQLIIHSIYEADEITSPTINVKGETEDRSAFTPSIGN